MPFYRGLNLSSAPFKSFCLFLTKDPPTEAVTLAMRPSILLVCFPPSFPLPRPLSYQCRLFVLSFVSHRGCPPRPFPGAYRGLFVLFVSDRGCPPRPFPGAYRGLFVLFVSDRGCPPRPFPGTYRGLFVSFVSHQGYLIHCFSSFLHIDSASSLLCSQTPSFPLFTSSFSFTLLMASTSQVRFSLFFVVYFSSLFVFLSVFLYF